jgi:hypothetical protein
MYVGRGILAYKTPTVGMSNTRHCLWSATANVAANYDASVATRQDTLQSPFGKMCDAKNIRNT